jgi:hypothetical protein
MDHDLYQSEITGPFAKLCGGGTDNDGDMESCVSLAQLRGGGFAVRDTKLPASSGQELRFTASELVALAQHVTEHPEQFPLDT